MKRILINVLISMLFLTCINTYGQENYRLETKNEITWNDSPRTQKTSKLTGVLTERYHKLGSDITTIGFIYKDSEGMIYEQGVINLSATEKAQLYPLIKEDLPDPLVVGYDSWEWMIYYKGFVFKMAEKLGISPNDIILIED